jgi:hypothetical protein
MRAYFISDVSNWKNHGDFERVFKRLYDDPKASA